MRVFDRKRWLRFRLGTFLSIFAGAAAMLAFVGMEVRRCHREVAAVQRLREDYPVSIQYGRRFDDGPGEFYLDQAESYQYGPQWLKELLGVDIFCCVKSVSVLAPGNIESYKPNERGEWILDMTYKTGLTDGQLEYILAFPHLHTLDLSWHPVTDQGISRLAKLKSLRVLMLSRSAVADGCVEFLSLVSTLEKLDVSRTLMSDSAVDDLAERLPDCQLTR